MLRGGVSLGRLKTMLALFALIILLSSCIKIPMGDGESLEISKDGLTLSDSDGKESTVSIDKESESIKVSNKDDEEWEGTFGENVELPEDFPEKYLPIPEEANIISVQQMDFEDGKGTSVAYVYEGDIETLSEMYINNFEKNNFEDIEYEAFDDQTSEMDFIPISANKADTTYVAQLIDAGENNAQVTLIYGVKHE